MQELMGDGTTVRFVSHSIEQIQRLCHRVILLDHGRMIAAIGEAEKVCRQYS